MSNTAEKIEQTTIPLARVRRDGGTQMRESISEVSVVTYAEHMQDGTEFPSITVFYDGSDYWLGDGFHRCAAYERAEISEVPADVYSGTRKDAIRYALKANAENGRPRTSDDMRRAYRVAVENGLCGEADSNAVRELLNCSMRWANRLTQAARDKAKAERDAKIVELAAQGKTQREIAAEVGGSQATVQRALDSKGNSSEMNQGEPALHTGENRAEESANDELISAEEVEQARVAAKMKEQAREAKQAKIEERRQLLEKQAEDVRTGNMKAPEGLFDVIAIDPPWNYGREYDPETSRVANPYPEMSQAELLEIELPAKDDAVLFLWTTHQFIFDAKELIDKWGFTYKATMVWNKGKIGMGAWLRMQCEFCLVGVKGKPFFENTTYRDIISEPRREHSRKPDAFFKMVTDITAGRRLEYFSREKREEWEVFGNDIEKF